MAPHSSTLAWKIPWTEEPGGLQSMGSHRVGHNWSDLAAAAAAGLFILLFFKDFFLMWTIFLKPLLNLLQYCFCFLFVFFGQAVSCIGEGNGNPLQCSCLENPRDGGAWWAAIYGVAQSRTRLKRLSSSSNRHCFSHMISWHRKNWTWLSDWATTSLLILSLVCRWGNVAQGGKPSLKVT